MTDCIKKVGTQNVLEFHGSTLRNYCVRCHKFHSIDAILHSEGVPHCECGGLIKPDVVLYEEPLDQSVLNKALRAIRNADMLIIGGTSLVVYPAVGLIDCFSGKHLVLINKSETSRDQQADLCINQPIGEVFSKLKI